MKMQDIRYSEKDYLASEEAKELSILVSATTRCLPVALSKYLGEYGITQKLYTEIALSTFRNLVLSTVRCSLVPEFTCIEPIVVGISAMNWARRLAEPLYSGILQPQTMYQLMGGSIITVTRIFS